MQSKLHQVLSDKLRNQKTKARDMRFGAVGYHLERQKYVANTEEHRSENPAIFQNFICCADTAFERKIGGQTVTSA